MLVCGKHEGNTVRPDRLSAMPVEVLIEQKVANMQGLPPKPIVLGSEAVELFGHFTRNTGGKWSGVDRNAFPWQLHRPALFSADSAQKQLGQLGRR